MLFNYKEMYSILDGFQIHHFARGFGRHKLYKLSTILMVQLNICGSHSAVRTLHQLHCASEIKTYGLFLSMFAMDFIPINQILA